ncbi:potassium channel family protein [Streptomyces sp. CBMA152]|uniref:potassium channel family protein n=1 Tax=Streptomyces sp. CBMA152 TaxID=1896312 RepID=UPI0016615008|nr:potassium channel family protein [Streptomyces sp. CBMA152]MBD0741371.1 hypothetical protein [Streptomyces sp. CBMA152]
MFGFAAMVLRMVRAARSAWRTPEFRGVFSTTVLLLFSATLFYTLREGWSVLDSLYFAVCTGLTIGFGDLTPTSDLSKAFTVVYALLSVGLFVSLVAMFGQEVLRNKGAVSRVRARRREGNTAE